MCTSGVRVLIPRSVTRPFITIRLESRTIKTGVFSNIRLLLCYVSCSGIFLVCSVEPAFIIVAYSYDCSVNDTVSGVALGALEITSTVITLIAITPRAVTVSQLNHLPVDKAILCTCSTGSLSVGSPGVCIRCLIIIVIIRVPIRSLIFTAQGNILAIYKAILLPRV